MGEKQHVWCNRCTVLALLALTWGLLPGCAQRKYSERRAVGVVNERREVLSTHSEPSLELNANSDDTITARASMITETKGRVRKETKYKQCWEITHGTGNIIIDLVSIPFAILEGLFNSPKPDCDVWTSWGDWEDEGQSTRGSDKYDGEISFALSEAPACAAIAPTRAVASKGTAITKLNLSYPCLSESTVPEASRRNASIAVVSGAAGAATAKTSIRVYDVSAYLDDLVLEHFYLMKVSVLDRNSRYPIQGARVTIVTDAGVDVDKYIDSLRLAAPMKIRLREHMRAKYGNALRPGETVLVTDDDGRFHCVLPRGTNPTASAIRFSHRDYYFRELTGVSLSKNMEVETGSPNTVFLDDIGSKVRTEGVKKSY